MSAPERILLLIDTMASKAVTCFIPTERMPEPPSNFGPFCEYRRFSPEDIDALAEKILDAYNFTTENWVRSLKVTTLREAQIDAIKRVLQEEMK